MFYRQALAAIGALIDRGQAQGAIQAQVDSDAAARVIIGLAHMIVQMKFSGSARAQVVHPVPSLVHGYLAASPRPSGQTDK